MVNYIIKFRALSSDESVKFAECRTIEEAVELALALHSASKIPHHVAVYSSDSPDSALNLYLNESR